MRTTARCRICARLQVFVAGMAIAIGVCRSHAADAPPPTSRPPNVLFIVSDDLNMHLACYGDPIVKTPNIDRLARMGVRFDHAYCQYPVCNPSRTSFLSGLHPETTKVCDQLAMLRKSGMPDVVYLPEHFRNNGYFTAGFGKVEHGGHDEIKWDTSDDFKGGGDDESPSPADPPTAAAVASAKPTTRPARRAARRTATGNAEVARRMKGEGLPYTVERATDDDDPENTDDQIAAKTVNLLEHPKSDKPFFIAVGFHKPHVPHVAPRRYFAMYPLDQIRLTQVPPGDEQDIPPMALASKKNYQPNLPQEERRKIIRAYLACVSYLDAKMGQVMEAMDKQKLWDNTIVVFIGDHGWHFGEHNWWAKASLFEESCNAPLLIVAPGVGSGVSPRVVQFVDLYPTLSEMCSLPAPHQGEGRSIAALLKNPQQPWDHPAYTALHPGPIGRSVRNERYRYTEWDNGNKGVELYDHTTDSQEITNLAKDPEHKQAIEEMKKLLHRLPNPPAKHGQQSAQGQE